MGKQSKLRQARREVRRGQVHVWPTSTPTSAPEPEPAWTAFRAYQSVPADFLQDGSRLVGRVYENSRYTVIVSHLTEVRVIHLSIHRRDREAIHDWRDLHRIKNELVGPEHLGVEIYPPECELLDTSNQYHIWVFADPAFRLPFGYRTRLVAEGPYKDKARQRPFPPDARPADVKSADELEQMSQGLF